MGTKEKMAKKEVDPIFSSLVPTQYDFYSKCRDVIVSVCPSPSQCILAKLKGYGISRPYLKRFGVPEATPGWFLSSPASYFQDGQVLNHLVPIWYKNAMVMWSRDGIGMP